MFILLKRNGGHYGRVKWLLVKKQEKEIFCFASVIKKWQNVCLIIEMSFLIIFKRK